MEVEYDRDPIFDSSTLPIMRILETFKRHANKATWCFPCLVYAGTPASSLNLPTASLLANTALLQLLPLLPHSVESYLTRMEVSCTRNHSNAHLLPLAIYLLSNKLVNRLNRKEGYKLLQIFKEPSIFNLLNSSAVFNQLSIKAALESVFLLAVEAQDIAIVQQLLEIGMKPNNYLCYHSDYKPYPLSPVQYAFLAGNEKWQDCL